jgi:catechol 2,3-dioxygenase-like lactoylglutathione lyase family enzyme
MLLKETTIAPSIPVTDIKRARTFYEDTLGLQVIAEDSAPSLLLEASWGSMLYLYQRGPSKADHTLAGFQVHNLESIMDQLKAKGVKFEEYDMPDMGLKTQNGIATFKGGIFEKGAWFKDPDGNILSLNQMSDTMLKAARDKRTAASATR